MPVFLLFSLCPKKGLASNIPRNIKPRRFLKEKKAKTFGTFLVEKQTFCHSLEVCIVQFCVSLDIVNKFYARVIQGFTA